MPDREPHAAERQSDEDQGEHESTAGGADRQVSPSTQPTVRAECVTYVVVRLHDGGSARHSSASRP